MIMSQVTTETLPQAVLSFPPRGLSLALDLPCVCGFSCVPTKPPCKVGVLIPTKSQEDEPLAKILSTKP